jgi:hypothetical protein
VGGRPPRGGSRPWSRVSRSPAGERPVFAYPAGVDGRERTGDRLVRVGSVLFGVGVVAVLVTVLPLFLGTARLPVGFYLLSMLAPAGLALALLGLVVSARQR